MLDDADFGICCFGGFIFGKRQMERSFRDAKGFLTSQLSVKLKGSTRIPRADDQSTIACFGLFFPKVSGVAKYHVLRTFL